jgi:hypothetical protein
MPTIELIKTMTKITLKATVELSMLDTSFLGAFRCINFLSLNSVCEEHTERRQEYPEDNPEKIEGNTKNKRINPIP